MGSDRRLSVNEQAVEAARLIDSLFDTAAPPLPEGATVHSLWIELCRLKGKTLKPKKVNAVKLLLEDERLTGLTVALLADIIRRVFARHSLECNTSESSMRWYISQMTQDWDIKPRDKGRGMFELE